MLLDENLEFCDASSLLVPDGTAGAKLVGDVIDLGSPGVGGVAHVTNFPGDGEPVYLVVTCATQILTGGTAGAIQFFLMSDDVAAIDPATATVHASSGLILTDDATALGVAIAAGDIAATPNQVGGNVPIMMTALPSTLRYERYLGVTTLILTTTITAGAINAFITKTPKKYIAYRDALASGS